ncbi:hypothetical protein SAMN05444679_102130 [Variovorax sp. CF079]|uniref:hypothetical protein n=1 Tax=Variovorax sp. CF079 TaxID=1882774 RepID=UPI000883D315|nr:hypothetical protein [Variovorax sp. CF079]SDC27884.1 hypothetical protein SAMN05444679_102130 [Variovorax sp. CF079]
MSGADVFALAFAVAMTMLMASVGFNRPTWARSYTTAARYRMALTAHVVLYVLLLFTVYAFLARLTADPEASGPSDRFWVLWLSLAAVACVRAIAPIARRVRNWLHRLGDIPSGAGRFAKFLAETDFDANESVHAQARALLVARGIDAERDWLPLAQPMHRLLSRTTELFIQLRAWEEKPRFAGFSREAKNELFRLRQRFDRLTFRVSRALAFIEQLGEIKQVLSERAADCPELDDRLRKLVSDTIADVCDDISLFYRDTCVLTARGIMATEATRRGRDAAISRLGFTPKNSKASNPYRALLYAACLLYIGLWIFFLVVPSARPPKGTDLPLAQRIPVITLIVLGSLAVAIVPKLRWGFANGGLHRETPWAFVVLAGACAVVFSILVNLAAGALFLGGADGAWLRLTAGAPYLHSGFFTAGTVAWLVQDHRWTAVTSPRAQRLRDAAVLGLAWFAASLLAAFLLTRSMDGFIRWTTLAFVAGGFIFGSLIGYLIPHLVRNDGLHGPNAALLLPASDFDVLHEMKPAAGIPTGLRKQPPIEQRVVDQVSA